MITRGLERVLITLSATLCVYLGYRLLLAMPQSRSGEGKVELPLGTSIVVSRVGPGVFFALFGCVMICISLFQALRVDRSIPVNASAPTTNNAPPTALFASGSSGLSYLQTKGMKSEQFSFLPEDVFRDLYLLNEMTRSWRNDLDAALKLDLARTIVRAKMLVLRPHWQPAWGSPTAFQEWVLAGASGQPPADTEPAWQLFNHGNPSGQPTP